MHHPDTRAELNKTAAPPSPGWGPLPCPRCTEVGTIAVDLDDLARFYCNACEEDFTRDDLEALIAAWTPVLAWLGQAPVKE
jgi:transposase-like protein